MLVRQRRRWFVAFQVLVLLLTQAVPVGAVEPAASGESGLRIELEVAAGPTALEPGRYAVEYRVTFSNDIALATPYALSLALPFAPNVVVDARSAVSEQPADLPTDDAWTGSGSTTNLAEGTLQPGESHSYLASVEVTVPDDLSDAQRDCQLDADESGTGLRAEASLVAGDQTLSQVACAPIPTQPAPLPQPTATQQPTVAPQPTSTQPSAAPEPSAGDDSGALAAEGTSDDEPSSIGLLSVGPGGTSINGANTFYAYVEAGENLDIGFSKTGNVLSATDVVITVRGPGGFIDTCTALETDPAGTGCSWSNLASATAGVWQVDFQPVGTIADRYAWEIDVQAGATSIEGRVYSEEYVISQQSGSTVDFGLWYQSEHGFLYQAAYVGYNGINSRISSDSVGVRYDGTCDSAHQSAGQGAPAGTSLAAADECGDRYKIFFEEPATDLPAIGTLWDSSTDWIKPPIQNPTLSNVAFAPDSATVRSGTVTFDLTDFTGPVTVQIDTNNDGLFDGPADVTVTGFADAGSGQATFDGLDGQGNPVSAFQDIAVRVSVDRVGEIHFSMSDVELLSGGLEIVALNGAGAGGDLLYWDDSQLSTTDPARCSTTPQTDGTGGVPSTGGVHGWGPGTCTSGGAGGDTWGNGRTIDNWTYQAFGLEDVLAVPGDVLPAFDCAPSAYLFRDFPTDVWEGDLATGSFTLVADQIADGHINGVGYNVLDDYIYGWSNSTSPGGGTFPTGLVRIGSDYSVDYLGVPTGLTSSTLIGQGDVDDAGQYWGRRTDLTPNQWVQIDLDPVSPDFGTVVASGNLVPPAGLTFNPDWSFNPVDGLVYGIASAAGDAKRLISFDRTTHIVSDVGSLGTLPGLFGATYMDSAGFLYVSENLSGAIYRVDVNAVTATFFADGPTGGQNDGARCAAAPLPIDFGDAPDSYGTTLGAAGALHAVPGYDEAANTAPLMLGSLIDVEADGVPTPGSDGDDAADVDDEDAVAGPIAFTAGQPTTLPVTVTNDTDQDATLAAWADLDGNGTFDTDELATVTVPANSGTAAHDVTFGAPFPVCQNVRFRVLPGVVADPSPTGPASAGEVEDHPAIVAPDCTVDDIPLTISGFAQAWTPNSSVQTSTLPASNALNAPDDIGTQLYSGFANTLTLDLSTVVPEGNAVTIHIAQVGGFEGPVRIDASADGVAFSGLVTHTPSTTQPTYEALEYVVPAGGARYIRIVPLADASGQTAVRVDAATYSFVTCECEDAINFVVDGSFEDFTGCSLQDGTFGAWTTIDGNVHIWGENCPSGWASPDGVNSIDLDGQVGNSGGIQQAITGLTPGNSYNLTFSMAFNPAAGAESSSMRVQVADFDETYTSASNATLGGFNLVHVEFTADGTTELLRFESLTGSGDPGLLNGGGTQGYGVVLDDIRITPMDCDERVYDYGDAPVTYGTTSATNGAAHAVPGYDPDTNTAPLMLGPSIDSESDGQPTLGADGDDLDAVDDEDGVDINPTIPGNVMVTQAGGLNTAQITVTGSGFLSAWIDLDYNGAFDPGEAIFDDEPVVDGVNNLTFTVPNTVSHGQTYARFRLTLQEGVANTPTGPAPDGEVEDYVVHIAAPVSQACEAGLVNSGFEQPADPDAVNIYDEDVVPGWSFVAANPTAGTEFQRNAIEIWTNAIAYEGSQFAEINAYVFGYLYQDMVTTPGTTLTWQFAHRGRAGNDTIALNIGAPGATVNQTTEVSGNTAWELYTGQYVVPAGQFITRFEFQAVASAGGNSAIGNFLDGIAFGIECPTDFGDAPASYGTSLVDDGARHQISMPDESTNTGELMLGPSIDKELDGLPGTLAGGDDTDTVDDEDGVAGPILLSVGDPTTVTVSVTNDTGDIATLAGWIDLNGNGAFEPGERQTITVTASGDYDLVFPAATTLDTTYARFRLFSGDVADPEPTGLATGGEVEDYRAEVSGYDVVKTANPASGTAVRPGQTVTYTLTLTNVGTVDLVGVEADDDLGGVLDDADLTAGPVVTPVEAGTAEVTGDILSFVGDIPAGEQVTVSYTVTALDPSESGGDAVLGNVVTSADSVNCPEPAADPADPDCVTEHPIPDLTVVKTSDPVDATPVAPGDTITYTLVITNTGGYDYPVADPAEATDDLSGVIDDAFYNGDADDGGHPGTIDYTAPVLTWTGPLAVDEVVTITYTVTVLSAENLGDAVIENLVTAPDSECTDPPADPVDPDCVTNHEVGAVHYQKTADPADPLSLQPGDTFTYTITVANIGAIDLAGLSFSDDLSGVLDDATFVGGSVTVEIGTAAFDGTNTVEWSGDLTVGQVATVTYQVTIDNPPGGDTMLINGVLGTGPGSNCAPPGPATDADCFKQIPQPLINTIKTSDAVGDVEPGDVVEYQFTVSNTGTGPARIFEVVDDLGDVLDDAAYNGDAALVSGPGGVAFDAVNQEMIWTGGLLVGEIATVSYSVTVGDATELGDGVLLNAVTSPDCFEPAVTDPEDPQFNPDCVTITRVRAWTALKTSNAAGDVEAGDVITYSVVVENTGGVDLPAAEVVNTDDLTDVLDDASYNGNAADGGHPGTFDFSAPLLTWSADLAVDEIVTLTYSVTVNDATDLGDGQLLNAVTGASNCPEPAITDPAAPDFDPDCVTIEDIRAWTAVKTSDAADPALPGDTITYTVEIENTGNVDLSAADVVNTDDLSDVLDDASYNGDAGDGGHAGAFDLAAPTLTWSGALDVGEVVILTYSVTVNAADALGDGQLLNAVTGSPNCPDPAITDPDDPNFNPDCVVMPDIEAWTVVKSSDASDPVLPGDVVEYSITVTNTGNVVVDDPTNLPFIEDDLTDVLDDAGYNADADSGGNGVLAYGEPVLSWEGSLLVGQVVTITYSVTVNDADALGDGQLLNAVTGSPNCPDPAITDPDDPNFNPDCVVMPDIEAWTVVKSSDASDPVLPGDVVSYTLTVTNTGNVSLDQPGFFPSVTDDLTGVLDDGAYNDDAGDGGVGLVTYGEPVLQWEGPLAVDDIVTITYSVTVNDADELGDGQLLNAVTGSPNCPDPAITDPDDPNFNPDCVVMPDIEAWTVVKSSDASDPVLPGDVVSYTLTVTNTGNVDLTAADVSIDDDLSSVIDDAAYNDDADSGATYLAPTLTWSGDLVVDQVVTITYSVTVNDADELGDGQLLNAVTGSPNCPDPAITDQGDPNFNPDCVVDPLVAAYTVVKTSTAPAPAMPGDTVEYTVIVTNTGGVGLVGADAAEFSDDLSGVLDDASFNDDAAADLGTATFAEPDLAWSGDLLVDEAATITYSVTVNAPISGDFALTNAVTGGDCPGPAVTDPEDAGFDPDCVNIVLLPGVHLEKVIFGEPVTELEPGNSFEYVVTVTNIGQVDLVAETFSDDLSAVLDDATLDLSSLSADVGVVNYAEPQITWIGDLAVGEVATVRYTVTIDDPITGDGELLNGVAGSIYSNCVPPDPDDPDCWEEFPLPNVVVAKELVGPADPVPGDVVTYRITAENQGGATAEDEVVSDDLSGVLDDAVYNGDASASLAGDLSFTDPELLWVGDIAPTETVTITYSLTVNAADQLGDGRLLNAVTGGQCPDPAITDPLDPGFDADCVTIEDVAAWVSVKTSDADAAVAPSDTVTYTITVENTGNVALTDPADLPAVDDDMSEVLDDATYNHDAVADAGSLSYGQPTLSWAGELAVDQVVTISYSITVNEADELGDGQLMNTITGAPNCPEPAIVDPDDPAYRVDCATRTGVLAGDVPDTALPWLPIPEPMVPFVLLGGLALGGAYVAHAASACRGRRRDGRSQRPTS